MNLLQRILNAKINLKQYGSNNLDFIDDWMFSKRAKN